MKHFTQLLIFIDENFLNGKRRFSEFLNLKAFTLLLKAAMIYFSMEHIAKGMLKTEIIYLYSILLSLKSGKEIENFTKML